MGKRPSSDEHVAREEREKQAGSGKSAPQFPSKNQRDKGVPVHLDAVGALLFRSANKGTAQLFDRSPAWLASAKRGSIGLRGGAWLADRHIGDTLAKANLRLGGWLGYRYEPGASRTVFTGMGSQGAEAWMLAHDVSVGLMLDVNGSFTASTTVFARISGGTGLTFTTLQLDSLDDGHIYSQTEVGWHAVATVEAGLRTWEHRLELFAGVGRLETANSKLELEQTDAAAPTEPLGSIGPVNRDGFLLYAGIGWDF